MHDIHVLRPHQPGALALLGEALGQASVSLAGGGLFFAEGKGHAAVWLNEGDEEAHWTAEIGEGDDYVLRRLWRGVTDHHLVDHKFLV